jgi:hypothetical protein
MSATTPAPTAATDATRSPHTLVERSAPHPVGRFGGPVALLVGGFLAAAGMGLHLPAMPEDVGIAVAIAEAPSRWMASHLLMSFGFALVAIGAASAFPRHRGRGATVTAIGVALTSLGAAVMALGDVAHGVLGFALAEQVDVATSFEVQRAFFATPMSLSLNVGPPLITLGMVLLGAGLLRSRTHARSIAIAILLAPIGVNLAFTLELPTSLHGVPLVIGLTAFAYALVRGPRSSSPVGPAATS